jgi:hypothetical protein
MPAQFKPTPEDFVRLSELVEVMERAKDELTKEVFRLFPKNHPACRYLLRPDNMNGMAHRLKSGLEESAARRLGEDAPVVGLFFGPDRERARQWVRDNR